MNDHRDEPIPRLFSLMARFTGGVDFNEPATLDAMARVERFLDAHLRGDGR